MLLLQRVPEILHPEDFTSAICSDRYLVRCDSLRISCLQDYLHSNYKRLLGLSIRLVPIELTGHRPIEWGPEFRVLSH